MELFPAGLASTLIPAIFIGVLVTFLFTEMLGWTFTGLVVPGYLASVALVSPRAATLMVIEALLSLVLVRLVSDGADRLGVGSRFFGRERFFLTLALATGLRLAVERVLLPLLATHSALGALALGQGDLAAHSIGLVLVPLMCHTLDRVGVGRGLGQLAALTGITGALVWLLVHFTNLSLSDLTLTFEDVAFSIDRSPKAYVVLLAGALLAMRANVAFGWDFHGIIVPGLLAVAWFTPAKVALTFVEAVAALALTHLALTLPGLRSMQVEGPRRLLLVFCADAVLRIAVVAILGHAAPFLSASDFYGFGYLLPTLLAVKIWQRGSLFKVVLPAAQVSLGGFLLGNVLMMLFGGVAGWLAPAPAAAAPDGSPPVAFERAVYLSRAYVARTGAGQDMPADEARAWKTALGHWADGEPTTEAFARLPGMIASPLTEMGGVLLHEKADDLGALRGLGAAALRPTGHRLIVGVPRPLDGAEGLYAADLARALDARGVFVSGQADADATSAMASWLGRDPYTLARRQLTRRGWTWIELRVDPAAPPGGVLRVPPGRVPDDLDVNALRASLPELKVEWTDGPAIAVAAPAATWRELTAAPCQDAASSPIAISPAYLAGDGALPVFTPAEQLLLAEQVLAPLASGQTRGPGCRVAAALGLRVVVASDAAGVQHAAVVPADRGPALALVRLGKGGATIVGTPRSDLEPYTRRAAFALYQALDARALLIGGHPGNATTTTYDAAGEVVGDALGNAITVVEVRGAGEGTEPLAEGAVIAWGGVPGAPAITPEWLPPIEEAATRVGLSPRRYDGTEAMACCGDLHRPWRSRLTRLGRGQHATIFVSQDLRRQRFGADDAGSASLQAISLGLPYDEAPLDRVLGAAEKDAPAQDRATAETTFQLMRRWAELRHAGDLRALAGRSGLRLARDSLTGEALLVLGVRAGDDTLLGVVNLRDPGADQAPTVELAPGDPVTPEAVARLRHGGLAALWRHPK